MSPVGATSVFVQPIFGEGPVVQFLEELFLTLEDESDVVIDFSNAEFAYPFGTLLMALGIREFVRIRKGFGCRTQAVVPNKNNVCSYLKYFGFFNFVGLPLGNEPGFEASTNRYLPITEITKASLLGIDKKIQAAVERKSYALAKVIFAGVENESKAQSLTYCFREIIRNVFEHSEESKCVLMAQRWSNGYAEIAIADEGIGLFNSLSKRHAVADEDEAIKLALMPGISSASDNKSKSIWKNSGYGLYVISQLGNKYGEFTIASSKRMLLRIDGADDWDSIPVHGTMVKLRINLAEIQDFQAEIDAIVLQGEKEAEKNTSAIKVASTMSKVMK